MEQWYKALGVAMAIAGVHLFAMDSSGDEEEAPPTMARLCFLRMVPSLDNDEFRRHFRLRRDTFELLVNAIGKYVSNVFQTHGGRATVDVSQQLLMSHWMLATPDSYRYCSH